MEAARFYRVWSGEAFECWTRNRPMTSCVHWTCQKRDQNPMPIAPRTMSSHLWLSMVMGEERMYIYMCVNGSPCCTVEKNIVLGK